MTVYMRVEGASTRALTIEGKVLEDDQLLLMMDTAEGQPVQITARRSPANNG